MNFPLDGDTEGPEGPPHVIVDFVRVSAQDEGVMTVGSLGAHALLEAHGLDLGGRIADVARWVATPGRSQPPVFL